jgi:P-aminobenzoate N-oxygenase AurF
VTSVSELRVAADGRADAAGPPAYASKFATWERRASVRTKPRRELDEVGTGALFFPPELVPALAHPDVVDRGPATAHRILVQSLHHYMHFTVVLEQATILPVTAALSLGDVPLDLPGQMRADAFKITTDEAWHGQFCYDFMRQVADVTGVAPAVPEQLRLTRRLAEIRESLEPGLRRLGDLLFAVVSETLVSSLLCDIPNDKRLPVAVRAVVGDHAEDEGRHHAYFRAFLRVAWPQLTSAERRAIGPRVPEFVDAFLSPDLGGVAMVLADAGFGAVDCARIVDEAYLPSADTARMATAAKALVRGFTDVGALDDAATAAAFAQLGLVAR